MAEEFNWEKLKPTKQPLIIPLENGIIAVEYEEWKNKEDGKVSGGVRLVTGYNGKYGFVPQKKIKLPVGITSENWTSIMKAYNELSK